MFLLVFRFITSELKSASKKLLCLLFSDKFSLVVYKYEIILEILIISNFTFENSNLFMLVFRPVEVKLHSSRLLKSRMDAYCEFKVGRNRKRTVTDYNTLNPTWVDAVLIERKNNEKFAKISIKNSHSWTIAHKLGKAYIDLSEVMAKGNVIRWYRLKKRHRACGEVRIQIAYVDQFL